MTTTRGWKVGCTFGGVALVVALAGCSCGDDDDDDDATGADAGADAAVSDDAGASDGGGEDAAVDRPPFADAGADQVAETRHRVTLDASGSSDPEGQPLFFSWVQIAGPNVRFDVAGATASFWAPSTETELAFEVTVSDGNSSAVDDVAVRVIELEGPRAPIDLHPFLPRLPTEDARGVAVRGDAALVADAVAGLVVFDLTALGDDPQPVAVVPIDGAAAQSIALQDDLAYVGARGVRIFDVSDPSAPALVGSLSLLDANADRIAVANGRVYLGDFGLPGGLVVVDASDPATPTEASRPDIDSLFALTAHGDWAYVGGFWGIDGIDATDPAAPRVREVSGWERIRALVPVPGTDLIVASCPQTHVLDATDPSALTEVTSSLGCGTAAALSGTRIFLSVGDELVDVGYLSEVDAAADFSTLTLSDAVFHSERSSPSIDVWGDLVLVAAGTAGVLLVDTTPDEADDILGEVATGGRTRDVAWAGGDLVVTTADPNGLHTIDPDARAIVGSAVLPDAYPQGLAVAEPRAYVAGDEGVRILDVSDPSAPAEIGFVDAYATAVAVSGTTVYVGTGLDTNFVYDATDPAAPVQVGSFSIAFPEGVADLALTDDVLLVGDRNAFAAFDVADPTMPAELLRLSADNAATAVTGAGGVAFFTDAGSDFQILDIEARPPTVIGGYEPGQFYADIDVRDGFLYVAAGNGGVQILDVTDPAFPVRAGFFDTSGGALASVAAGADRVALASEVRGVLFVDDMSALALSPDHVLVDRGGELVYAVVWADRYPGADEQLACVVSAGTCTVEDVDQAAASATVRWALPDEAADHELAVAVGNTRTFLVRRDRVRVQ